MSKVKKSKILIPKTAKDCNVSEEFAEDVISFYYSELRKEMENLQVYKIRVPILGTFVISRPKISRSIKKLKRILKEGKPENFNKIEEYNLNYELKEKQEKLLDKINKEKDEQNEKRNYLAEQKKNS